MCMGGLYRILLYRGREIFKAWFRLRLIMRNHDA